MADHHVLRLTLAHYRSSEAVQAFSTPHRERTALLQGIIICGRCGGRRTVRYHQRAAQHLPTYVCQRDGIANGHRICTTIPGHSLDQRIGMLLIETVTPLAIEAALTVQAELQHRADEADALRAAHVERARYHADLARRRYLAVDPANRLVADTLEADWNTALRAQNQAQEAYDNARQQHLRQLTDTQKARIQQLVTDLPAIWNDPLTPARERKRIARLLLTDVTAARTSHTITARTSAWPAGKTAPCASRYLNRPGSSARPPRRSSPPSMNCSTTTPTPRSLTSSTPAACSAAKAAPSTT